MKKPPNEIEKDSQKGKRRLDFKEKKSKDIKLPLSEKTIYVDVKDGRQRQKIEADLKSLGAKVDTFLSKDIHYMITSQPRPGPSKQDDGVPSPASPADVNTPSPFNCGPSPNPAGGRQGPPENILRGKAIMEKAKSSRKLEVVEDSSQMLCKNAEKLGVKIVGLDAALKWIQRELAKLPATMLKGSGQTKERGHFKVKNLKSPFIKFEALNKQYKAIQQQLTVWPRANTDTPRGTCPFDGTGVRRGDRSREERGDRIGLIPLEPVFPDTPSREEESAGTPSSKSKAKRHQSASIVGGVRIVTAGEIRRQKEQKRMQERKRGYCECCEDKYEDLHKHILDDKHKAFVRNKKNYEDLDAIIRAGPDAASFVQQVIRCRKHSETGRSSSQSDDNPVQKVSKKVNLTGNKAKVKQPKASKVTSPRKRPLLTCSRHSPRVSIRVKDSKTKPGDATMSLSNTEDILRGKVTPTKSKILAVNRQSPRIRRISMEEDSHDVTESIESHYFPARTRNFIVVHHKSSKDGSSHSRHNSSTMEHSAGGSCSKDHSVERRQSQGQSVGGLGESGVKHSLKDTSTCALPVGNTDKKIQAKKKEILQDSESNKEKVQSTCSSSAQNLRPIELTPKRKIRPLRLSLRSVTTASKQNTDNSNQNMTEEVKGNNSSIQQDNSSQDLVKLKNVAMDEVDGDPSVHVKKTSVTPASDISNEISFVETTKEAPLPQEQAKIEKVAMPRKLRARTASSGSSVQSTPNMSQHNKSVQSLQGENFAECNASEEKLAASPRRNVKKKVAAIRDGSQILSTPDKVSKDLANANPCKSPLVTSSNKSVEKVRLDKSKDVSSLIGKEEAVVMTKSTIISPSHYEEYVLEACDFVEKIHRLRATDRRLQSVDEKVKNLSQSSPKKTLSGSVSTPRKNSTKADDTKMVGGTKQEGKVSDGKLSVDRGSEKEEPPKVPSSPKFTTSPKFGRNQRRRTRDKNSEKQKDNVDVDGSVEIESDTSSPMREKETINTQTSMETTSHVTSNTCEVGLSSGQGTKVIKRHSDKLKSKRPVKHTSMQTDRKCRESLRSLNTEKAASSNHKVTENNAHIGRNVSCQMVVSKVPNRSKSPKPVSGSQKSDDVFVAIKKIDAMTPFPQVQGEGTSSIHVVPSFEIAAPSALSSTDKTPTKSNAQNDQKAAFSLTWHHAKGYTPEGKAKKVKLNKSWTLLSNRSVVKLFDSELDDEESFEGFEPDEIQNGSTVGSEASYVETKEIELEVESDREWYIEQEEEEANEEEEEDLSAYLPKIMSSPGRRSDSSWGDACMEFIDSHVSNSKANSSMVLRSSPKKSPWKKGLKSPMKSPAKRAVLKSRKNDKKGGTRKRKFSPEEVNVEGESEGLLTPKRKKRNHRGTVTFTEDGIEHVDEEIEFNYLSPQKLKSIQTEKEKDVSSSPLQGNALLKTSTPHSERPRKATQSKKSLNLTKSLRDGTLEPDVSPVCENKKRKIKKRLRNSLGANSSCDENYKTADNRNPCSNELTVSGSTKNEPVRRSGRYGSRHT